MLLVHSLLAESNDVDRDLWLVALVSQISAAIDSFSIRVGQ